VRTPTGFELAEVDLDLRGGGQLLGTRQSGLTDLKFAHLRKDRPLLERARALADELVDVEGPCGRRRSSPRTCPPASRVTRHERREFLAAAAAVPFTLRSALRAPLASSRRTPSRRVVVVDPMPAGVAPDRDAPGSAQHRARGRDRGRRAHGRRRGTLLRDFAVRHVLRSFDEPRYTAACARTATSRT
jgi:hypothetical protein